MTKITVIAGSNFVALVKKMEEEKKRKFEKIFEKLKMKKIIS